MFGNQGGALSQRKISPNWGTGLVTLASASLCGLWAVDMYQYEDCSGGCCIVWRVVEGCGGA